MNKKEFLETVSELLLPHEEVRLIENPIDEVDIIGEGHIVVTCIDGKRYILRVFEAEGGE